MQAEQTATSVVHQKIIVDMGKAWSAQAAMYMMAVSSLDGKLVTGFALG